MPSFIEPFIRGSQAAYGNITSVAPGAVAELRGQEADAQAFAEFQAENKIATAKRVKWMETEKRLLQQGMKLSEKA